MFKYEDVPEHRLDSSWLDDKIDREIDRLLYAPLTPRGKTRYDFKTKTEIRDFTESFKKGVSGKPAPRLHGVAQKYQDAANYGWEQGRKFRVGHKQHEVRLE